MPDTYVTVYIFSELMVLVVKTDSDGNWSYIIENPETGKHEVYVAVTDNAGKVTAKSKPLQFVQTAEAAIVTPPSALSSSEEPAAPGTARLRETYLIIAAAVLGGLILALAAIGMLRSRAGDNG